MNEVMAKIELSGPLGKAFGKAHERLVSSTAEVIRALCCTIKGFEQYLNTSKQRGLTYAVFLGKRNIGQDDLGYPLTEDIVRIVPVLIGSKKAGLLQTILGAVLVIAGYALSGYTSGASMSLVGPGVALMAGGVIQMLSPQPAGLSSKRDADNQASYAFGGVTNTASQGYPVPLLYGKRRIGGAIISAGIYVEDQQ